MEMGNPLRTEHSHWSMFEYKKGFSLQPMRELELWDSPLPSLANVDQQESMISSEKMLYFSGISGNRKLLFTYSDI